MKTSTKCKIERPAAESLMDYAEPRQSLAVAA
jgi:hypothetical protein